MNQDSPDQHTISSPKLTTGSRTGVHGWYQYYAGYSPIFVSDVIRGLELNTDDVLVDPWNGAGTTTQVAFEEGRRATGYDLNPAMVVVAKAKLLGGAASSSETALVRAIVESAADRCDVDDHEPLAKWFKPTSAGTIRALEKAIRHHLVPTDAWRSNSAQWISGLSPLAAFFYLALFRVVREHLRPFLTTNPTWIKSPKDHRERVNPSSSTLCARFEAIVASMASGGILRNANAQSLVDLAVADSSCLPNPTASTRAIISSPPYCTRIDYAVATAPELATLGFSADFTKAIRLKLLGTATPGRSQDGFEDSWGPTCADFLSRVASHPSKASSTYYLYYHLAYFRGICASLREIDRILVRGGQCVLVVQDSFYKNVHNDLPQIYCEMGEALGWDLQRRHNFPWQMLMSRLHPGRKLYGSNRSATEAVLWFTKTSL